MDDLKQKVDDFTSRLERALAEITGRIEYKIVEKETKKYAAKMEKEAEETKKNEAEETKKNESAYTKITSHLKELEKAEHAEKDEKDAQLYNALIARMKNLHIGETGGTKRKKTRKRVK